MSQLNGVPPQKPPGPKPSIGLGDLFSSLIGSLFKSDQPNVNWHQSFCELAGIQDTADLAVLKRTPLTLATLEETIQKDVEEDRKKNPKGRQPVESKQLDFADLKFLNSKYGSGLGYFSQSNDKMHYIVEAADGYKESVDESGMISTAQLARISYNAMAPKKDGVHFESFQKHMDRCKHEALNRFMSRVS